MGRIGAIEIILILVVVLLLFGAKRLPEIGRALGRSFKEFRKAGKEIRDQIDTIDESDGQEHTS